MTLRELAAAADEWARKNGKWQGATGTGEALADALVPLLALAARGNIDLEAVIAARLALSPPSPGPLTRRGSVIPAYFEPRGAGLVLWNQLVLDAAKIPLVPIVNPNSGPASAPDAAYASVIDRLVAATARPVGYVSTSYGARAASAVNADVDRWKSFYPNLRGIFFDEQASGADKVSHYKSLFDHARSVFPGGVVVSNPGASCDEGYLTIAKPDILCLVETLGGAAIKMPDWAVRAPDGFFAGLVYGASKTRMQDVVAGMSASGLGYGFVTNDVLANPWDSLPTFWAEEVAAIAAAPAITG